MQNQNLVAKQSEQYLIEFDNEQLNIIKAQYFPPSATPLEIDFCMSVAKSLGLNPLVNEIYFIERKSKVNGQWNSKIEPLAGRNAYRKIANRSGMLESIETNTYLKETPKLVNGEWVNGQDLIAICEIYKKGNENPFKVEIEYSEYVQKKQDGTPTKFWNEKPKTMLKKVAESQALRQAFDISGIYDESEVNDIDVQPQYINPNLSKTIAKTVKRRTPTKKESKAQEFIDTQVVPEHNEDTGELYTKKPDMSILDGISEDGNRKEDVGE